MSESEPIKRNKRKPQLSGHELIAQDMEAARLRLKERKQYKEIAEILGFKEPSAAFNAVGRHLKAEQSTDSKQLHSELLADLKEVGDVLMLSIRKGNTYDADRFVRVSERIAKLEGVDAPIKLEVTNVEQEIAEAQTIVSKFREKPNLSVVAS